MFGDVAFSQAPFSSILGGGGATVLANMEEFALASSALSATKSISANASESASAESSFIGAAGFGVSLAEAASALDDSTRKAGYVGGVAEFADASDLVSAVATINASVTGVQLTVTIGGSLVWAKVNDSQTPNWANLPS